MKRLKFGILKFRNFKSVFKISSAGIPQQKSTNSQMSLKKKDPSLRVAANDPHLVSLGGGRLSTAVTIHYIPIGDTTIGCSTTCSISLNGTGVRPTHCTIYRSEENEVTIVPEHDARILIDGSKITQETNLTQGAMITIGNSNYLRFNNPAEAQMMRSAMGSNERISMPQIDFSQVPTQQHNSTKRIGGGGSSSNASASNDAMLRQSIEIERFYEMKINPNIENPCSVAESKVNYNSIDINGLHCPKVFTADLVTVNMPAKDVLGQKYANFARNLAENHRNIDKNSNNALRNNQMSNLKTSSTAASSSSSSMTSGALGGAALNGSSSNYVNIPNSTNYIQNAAGSTEYLTKVNNVNHSVRGTNTNAYDRYPKPGTYGGLQIYPMNGVNTEINNCSANSSPHHQKANNCAAAPTNQQHKTPHLSNSEHERLEDMLKICTEYADRQLQQQNQIQNSAQTQSQSQNNSITSSPIVQNRIKTNGSLPRDKKSPFHQHDLGVSGTQQLHQALSNSSSSLAANHAKHLTNSSFSSSSPCSTGYENVRLIGQNRVEINGQVATSSSSPKTGYENIGKYVPQSPRTKIRTTCMSPKKHSEHATFSSTFGQSQPQSQPQVSHKSAAAKQKEYEQLIKTFEEKLELEMQAIEESSRYQPVGAAASLQNSPSRRTNKNINNLTLNLQTSNSLQNSPRLSKKPAPAPRHMANACSGGLNSNSSSNNSSQSNLQRPPPTTAASMCSKEELECSDVEKLLLKRKDCLTRIERLKRDISDLQKQENEALRELDLEKALVSAELNSVGDTMETFEQQLQLVQNKIHRMEAQRNAARVMEENQQAKLKQSIEMKQDQVKKLKIMLKQKPNNDCLKEELHNVAESLENDRKTFEDLEFQYLEEESEWQAYREDLHAEEAELSAKIAAQRLELKHLEKQEKTNQTNACSDARTLKQNLLSLLNELKQCQEHLKTLETGISDVTGQLNVNSSEDEDFENASASTASPPMQQLMQSTSLAAGGVMSQSLFGSTELLCPKRSTEDIMSKSVNENMFYNNKIEVPSSTPKRRPPMQVVDICSDAVLVENEEKEDGSGGAGGEVEVGVALPQNERVKFNLSLGSDDFEVNPLEKRVPSQDDIDRICKVTLDAPISTKGASTKIFDSIKEIERNRQLLLAQQGHHVIEHERQKMQDLKKKSHDEARAQYLSMLNCSLDGSSSSTPTFATKPLKQQQQLPQHEQMQEEAEESRLIRENGKISDDSIIATDGETQNSQATQSENNTNDHIKEQSSLNENSSDFSTKHRHSQPDLDHHHHHQQQQQMQQHHRNSRPLSESNSELSCADLLSENNQNCKSNLELGTNASGRSSRRGSTAGNRKSGEQNTSSDDGAAAAAAAAASAAAIKRSSVNSNETTSLSSERKRAPLPKHQRPLTRYLPIFSPDLNLRHHIESAGHQIALCPHVFVDAYSCRGYLHKLGATFHGWARRWFVLDRQRNALIYFSDKSERKPRGGAYFSTIDEVYLDHLNASKSGRPHCTFIVKTKKRSYQLQAASDATARIWIDAIITGAQGNLDY